MHNLPEILNLPQDDTIVAISTPIGKGALGIIRVSGPLSMEIMSKIWRGSCKPSDQPSMSARPGKIEPTSGIEDTAVLTVWREPKSFTGQDMAELTLHGNPSLLFEVERSLIARGARAAAPGEFTLRAIMNGKIEPASASAIAALINAPNIAAAKSATRTLGGELAKKLAILAASAREIETKVVSSIEFPDDFEVIDSSRISLQIDELRAEIEKLLSKCEAGARLSKTPAVVVAGPPNAGKSTLVNALLGYRRSIVHHIPGTTRDSVEEFCPFGEIEALLVDTAGLRHHCDEVELLGVEVARSRLSNADLVLLVLDGSSPASAESREAMQKTEGARRIVILNKNDLEKKTDEPHDIAISALEGSNLDNLRQMIRTELERNAGDALWAASWQRDRIRGAMESVEATLEALDENAFDAVAGELSNTEKLLREAAGENADTDIIAHILENFCVGK